MWYVVPPLPTASLSNVDCTVNFAREASRGGVKRRTGMSTKKSGLEKSRGAGRREKLATVAMAKVATRKMMKSVRTARVM